MTVTDAYRAKKPPPAPPVVVSDRQREILRLIAEGLTNPEIGERLGMKPRTVKAHSDVLRLKFGVAHKRQLPAAARRKGIIE